VWPPPVRRNRPVDPAPSPQSAAAAAPCAPLSAIGAAAIDVLPPRRCGPRRSRRPCRRSTGAPSPAPISSSSPAMREVRSTWCVPCAMLSLIRVKPTLAPLKICHHWSTSSTVDAPAELSSRCQRSGAGRGGAGAPAPPPSGLDLLAGILSRRPPPSLAGALSPALAGVSHARTCALRRPPLRGSPRQAPRRRSPWNPRQQAARRPRRARVRVEDLPPLAPSSTRPQSSRGNEHSLVHCPPTGTGHGCAPTHISTPPHFAEPCPTARPVNAGNGQRARRRAARRRSRLQATGQPDEVREADGRPRPIRPDASQERRGLDFSHLRRHWPGAREGQLRAAAGPGAYGPDAKLLR
jgi:hypothetical protein